MTNPLITAPSPKSHRRGRYQFIILIGLLFLVAASYSNTLYSPPVLDDNHTFIENPLTHVEDFSLSSLKQLSETVFGFSRLVPIISFAVDHRLANGSIVQFHITNILIHLITTLAVFFLIKSILQTPIGSRAYQYIKPEHFCLLVAALWALNPVQTNGVTYLVQRMTSMATMFYLAAITCYIQARLAGFTRRKILFYFCTAFFSILALLSKEIAATIPLTILLIEIYFFTPNLPLNFIKRIKPYQWVGISICIAAILPVIFSHFWPEAIKGFGVRRFTLAERLLTESRVIIFYITLLLLPLPGRLNLEHDFALSHSIFSPLNTLLSITLLLLLFVYALRAKRNNCLLSFGFLFFFMTLAIESTVIPLELVFEHRLYLPSVGFFIALISILDKALKYLSTRFYHPDLYKIFILIMIIIISVNSVLTTFRNNTWRDEITFQRDIVRKSPNKPRGYLGLANSLLSLEQHDEALELLRRAIDLSGQYYEVYVEAANNIMLILDKQGKKEEALEAGLKYIKETPYLLNAISMDLYLYSLAVVLRENDRSIEAFDAIKASLAKDNNYFKSLRLAEQILSDAYDNKEVLQRLNTVSTGDKQTTVCLGMTQLMLDIRDYEKAGLYLEKAKEIAPNEELLATYETRFQTETELNRLAEISSFEKHSRTTQNRQYSLLMSTITFIEKYYHPLLFTVDWLLDRAKTIDHDDPFITLAEARNFIRENKVEDALEVINSGIKNNPNFIPLYEIKGEIYHSLDLKQATADIAREILELYPGHPKWRYFLRRMKSVDNLSE